MFAASYALLWWWVLAKWNVIWCWENSVFFVLTTALSNCGEHFPSMNGEYEWFILSVEFLSPVSSQLRVLTSTTSTRSQLRSSNATYLHGVLVFSRQSQPRPLHWVRDKVNINNVLSDTYISLLLLRASSWTFNSGKERQVVVLSPEIEIWSNAKIYNFQCCQTAVKVSLWMIVLNYSFTASESWIVRTLFFNANCF